MRIVALYLLSAFMLAGNVQAREMGHYAPGVANIRDLAVPAQPGLYFVQYNTYYEADTYRDVRGDNVKTLPGHLGIPLDTKVDLLAVTPVFVWSTDINVLGANYAFYIAPSASTTSLAAKLDGLENSFRADTDASGLGDTLIQPLWLGWRDTHYDIALGTGVYLPTGRYDAGDNDNVGLGFYTGQVQLSSYLYLDETQASAFMLTATYETHSEKDGTDVTPGDHLTLEYGFSQYLTDRLEVGIAGFSQWQVGRDSRPAGLLDLDPNAKGEVHALGAQVAYWLTPRLNLSLKYMKEMDAKTRFEGDWLSLNLTFTPLPMF